MIQQFTEQPAYRAMARPGLGSHCGVRVRDGVNQGEFQPEPRPHSCTTVTRIYLMKVGIVGLLLYIGSCVICASRAISKATWPSGDLALIRRKILLAGVVMLAIDTTTSGGLGFPAIYSDLVALLGACYGPVWGPGAEERQPTAATTSPTVSRPLNV